MKYVLNFLICLIAVVTSAQNETDATRFLGKLELIQLRGVNGKVYEGKHPVFENRADLLSKSIDVHLIVVPATSSKVLDDPVVVLLGSIALTDRVAFYANNLPELRKEHDILLIDQRGSWHSNPLDCDVPRYTNSIYTWQDQKTFAKKAGACIREAQTKGKLEFYTTAQIIDDIEEVRNWLGYGKLNIWASGQGTVTARAYLRKYPDQVRTFTMNGVQPIEFSPWTQRQRLAREQLQRIFDECFADSACHTAYPELSEHFGLLYDRLKQYPEYTDLELPDGSMTKIGIDNLVLEDIIYRHLSNTTQSSLIPWIIVHSFQGDMQVLAQRASVGQRDVPLGTHLCLVCTEDPTHKNPRTVTYDQTTPFTSYFFEKEVQLCRSWPKSEEAPSYMLPFKSEIPALILSGSKDLMSPPGYGSEAASQLKNSKHYTLPGRGHDDVDACMIDLITEMIQEGSSKNLNKTCLKEELVVPFYVP